MDPLNPTTTHSPETDRDTLKAQRAAFEDHFVDVEDGPHHTEAEIQKLFDYFGVLVDLGDLKAALELLPNIHYHILTARQAEPSNQVIIDKLIEWNYLAVRFTKPSTKHFDDYEYYAEIIDICRTADEAQAASLEGRALQAELNLLAAYHTWVAEGGRVKNLDDDQREYLAHLEETVEVNCDEQLTAWHELTPPDYGQIIPVKRTLSKYYVKHRKPNAAIAMLKELLEDLPEQEGFRPTDLADLNMEIGAILVSFDKHAGAQPYFSAAHNIYAQAGEDFEVFAAQAESWVEECEKKK